MPNLLNVEVSPRMEKSISRAFTKRFIGLWNDAHPDGTIVHRDLMHPTTPYIDNDWIDGVYLPPQMERTTEMNAALALSAQLIAELQAADQIVITTPMYNFTIPAVLKSWFDYVVRPGLTFQLREGGLLENKVAKVLVISRDIYTPGSQLESEDHVTSVIRMILNYMGITDVEFVLLGGSFGVNTGKVKLEDHLALFDDDLQRAALFS